MSSAASVTTGGHARAGSTPAVRLRSVALHLTASVAIFAVPAALISSGATLRGLLLVPFWVIQSVGLLGFSNAAHECVHGHFLCNRTVDRWAGRFLHLTLLINYDAHRHYHLQHHAFTRLPDDPEGEYDYKDIPTTSRYWLQVLRWSIPPSPLLVVNQTIFVQQLRVDNSMRRRSLLLNELMLVAFVAGLVAVTVVVGPVSVLLAYVVPVLLVFPVAAFVTSLPEHFGLPEADSAFAHTRTILTSRWTSWLMWHFNFHTAHHAQPQTPFSSLPDLHAALEPDIVHVSRGYLGFHRDVLRRVRRDECAAGGVSRAG